LYAPFADIVVAAQIHDQGASFSARPRRQEHCLSTIGPKTESYPYMGKLAEPQSDRIPLFFYFLKAGQSLGKAVTN
jgi:hypothetical protein